MSDLAAASPAPPHLISVIVRSMDRPSLATALESIAAQDQAPLEVLVVNALGPGHAAVPATAGPHPVRWVDHGHGLRRSAAANAGLSAASGPWVIFLDDDDLFLPGHLSRLAAALQERSDAVAAYADVAYGRQGTEGWSTEHVFAAEFDPLRLRYENFLPLHAVMVRRDSPALRLCLFDEQLDLFEDWDWWLQLARLGPFVHVPGVSAHYVAADGGGSGVFADNAASAQARRTLLMKWLALDSSDERLQQLQALQARTREAAQSGAQLALAQRTERDLRTILAARDDDLAAAGVEIGNLGRMLQARSTEVDDAVAQVAELNRIVDARTREIDDAKTQIDGLQEILQSRAHEIDEALAQIAALQQVLLAREHDIAAGLEHIHNLQDLVSARDAEIANLRLALRRRRS